MVVLAAKKAWELRLEGRTEAREVPRSYMYGCMYMYVCTYVYT